MVAVLCLTGGESIEIIQTRNFHNFVQSVLAIRETPQPFTVVLDKLIRARFRFPDSNDSRYFPKFDDFVSTTS